MMRNIFLKKRILSVTAAFLLVITLTFAGGCGNETGTEESTEVLIEVSMVDIFYVEDNALCVDRDAYQLKQPYSVSASIEEIMANQKLSEKMIYNGFSIDEYNNVVLDIDVESSVTEEELVLNKAAVVCSLNQINDIASVRFVINTLDNSVVEDAVYTMNSFLFYDEIGGENLNMERLELYVPDGEGRGLDRLEVMVSASPQESLAECVIRELEFRDVFPEGTSLNRIYVKDGICYVDMNEAFDNSNERVSPELVIYSMVNSLTSVHGISGVKITISGQKNDTYRQLVDISGLLYFEGGLIN